ncbi:InlB B-repeat-containing protein [Phoenicibacter congonensis]|uniref:InlB B-repeat-containing protein n=1 Tax=Phoenicibacter congonensis TaxID=1944646 RepID=UPI0009A84FA0|nr:InlB B-repeat-containing protein [Phoenicibacter congonensis]
MKISTKNKFISVLMGVAMCPMMFPTVAFAADDDAAPGVLSSPTELIQPSESEGADRGASSGDTLATQSESTGEAVNATTGKAANEVAALAAETGGEGTTASVAEVNGKSYSSLQEAINAAQDGETVTLLTDATEDATIAAGKNITLDLGNKKLTNTNTGKATLTIAKGATATLKNGSIVGGTSFYTIQNNGTATFEDVTATAGNTDSSMIDNWGTLTIESGSYSGGLNVVKSEEDSTLNISGGRFELSYATNGYTGVVFAYGNTTITGGEFIQSLTTTGRWNHPQVVATGVVDGHTAITRVTGGHFVNKLSRENIFRGIGKGTSDNFEVSGGTFNKSISEGYCADGFIPTKKADGTYGVKEVHYVAQVGSKKYETLADAIRLAAKGKTIQLLTDATENITIASTKQITLDLNGHTLNGGTGSAKAAILNKGNVTITDTSAGKTGTIKRDDQGIEGETSYYVIDNNGTMVIDQANVVNNSGIKGSSLIRNGGVDNVSSLTINGGTFEQQNFIAVKNDGNGELTINGGTLTSNQAVVQNWNKAQILGGNLTGGYLWTDSYTEAGTVGETVIGGDAQFTGTIYMDVTSSNPSTLKIEGGKLNVTSWKVTPAAAQVNSSIAVSGGTFTAAVPENYCAAGYAPTANADGTYGVVVGVAQIGTKAYATLADAVAAAKDGDTITLLSDCNGDGIVVKGDTFPNGLTIDFAGHSYTVGGKLVGSSGTASNGFQLLKGNTIVMRNGSIYGDASVAGDDTTQWSGAPAIMIQNYSNLTLDGMTVKGGKETCYTLSNNNGDTVIKDSTIIAGQNTKVGGPFAFDVCRYASYPSVSVTVEGNSVIDGCVDVSGTIGEGQNRQLTITGGTFRKPISVSTQPANISISGGSFANEVPADHCAAGYAPVANVDGTYGVKQAVTVTFDSNEGTAVDSQLVTVGDKVVKPTDPTKEGYTFSGWFTDKDCTNAYDFDADVDGTQPEFTLYAGWKAAPATVEPGAGDNGNNGDSSSANENVNVNTVNNNGDKASSEAKMATVKTGDNLALVGGAIAVIAVAAAGVAVFALYRKKMN